MFNRRWLAFMFLFAVLALFGPCAFAQKSSSSSTRTKAWTPPKTPGGDPDLQGVWTSTTTAPFERPAQFGNRLFLTDQEYQAAEKQMASQRETDGQETVSSDARSNTGPTDHWTERAQHPSRHTS